MCSCILIDSDVRDKHIAIVFKGLGSEVLPVAGVASQLERQQSQSLSMDSLPAIAYDLIAQFLRGRNGPYDTTRDAQLAEQASTTFHVWIVPEAFLFRPDLAHRLPRIRALARLIRIPEASYDAFGCREL